MPTLLRAIATDYDGTLTNGGRPDQTTLDALRSARRAGFRVVLVTGRILTELLDEFPDADDHFDLLVLENGAILRRAGESRPLCAPVPDELFAALVARGIEVRRGDVLLAGKAKDALAALDEVFALGLDSQVVQNRGEMMILPLGVSKRSGLYEALGELGVSHHSTIAVGDAENDHALLDLCEVGIATGNAVDALKSRADRVVDGSAGAAITALVNGPIVSGRERVFSPRWSAHLGTARDGSPVSIPASQLNVLIAGRPGQGKSYLAGLYAERLISLGYSLVVFDPEGDHAGLGRLRGVQVLGGTDPLPRPQQLVARLRHRFASLVVDLSGLSCDERIAYLAEAPSYIEEERAHSGLPHWVFIEEAQHVPGVRRCDPSWLEVGRGGYCLVTYLPAEIDDDVLSAIDVVMLCNGTEQSESGAAIAATVSGASSDEVRDALINSRPGDAILAPRPGLFPGAPDGLTPFTVSDRATHHVRHWHKYTDAPLPADRRFYFRCDDNGLTGAVAANMSDLCRQLEIAEVHVVVHHARGGDLSRWVRDVVQDGVLADLMEEPETVIARASWAASRSEGSDRHRHDADVRQARRHLVDLIHNRYFR